MTSRREFSSAQCSQPIAIPDLDRTFCVHIKTLVSSSLAAIYEHVASQFDVAAMRRRGMASVLSYVRFERAIVPLAIGQLLHLRSTARLRVVEPAGPDGSIRRIMLDFDAEALSPPGAGEPRRYRDTLDDQPVSVGRVRALAVLINLDAKPTLRLVQQVPAELQGLEPLPLGEGPPGIEGFTKAPEGHAEIGEETSRPTVWGLSHTDINQAVFTGEYAALMEQRQHRLLWRAGIDVGRHQTTSVELLLNRPLQAGQPFVTRARLFRAEASTVLHGSIHRLGSDDTVDDRPAVVVRLAGQ